MARYYLVEESDASDIFTGFFMFIVIVALIAYLALSIGMFILSIFLTIGVIIGGVYAIVTFIKALIFACRTYRDIRARSGLLNFFKKLWQIEKLAFKTAFSNNFNVAKHALRKCREFRFLSFRKWMWLIVAPSVIFIGTIIICSVIIAQFLILFGLLDILLSILLVIFAIGLVISLCYSFWVILGKWKGQFSANNPFKQVHFGKGFNYRFLKLFCKNYYLLVGRNIKNIWLEGKNLILSNLTIAGSYTLFNFKKYLLLSSPVSVFITVAVCVALFTALTTIAFIPLIILESIWATIVTLFIKF